MFHPTIKIVLFLLRGNPRNHPISHPPLLRFLISRNDNEKQIVWGKSLNTIQLPCIFLNHGSYHLFQLDRVGVDFVSPPSQQLTTTRTNPHQNLPEESVLQTWYLAHRLKSQNKHQGRTTKDGHLPYLGWSPTNQKMVTHQKEVHYRFEI